MSELLQVDDALEKILDFIKFPTPETIPTPDALHRVLATDITAPIDLPSFDNSGMDGFAVRSEDLQHIPATLKVVMDIPAGVAPEKPIDQGEAARIMTGATLPPGADTVIPVEDTNTTWDAGQDISLQPEVTILRGATAGNNVRQIGENVKRGTLILKSGTVIRPQDVGMLAGLGIATVSVYRKPRVAVLSTGDELLDITDPLTPGKIRDTNSYTIAGLISLNGGNPIKLPPAKDSIEAVRKLFQNALSLQPDLIVSSAGVSVGTLDVVRTVLDELGQINFWRVNVRPGKPIAFGQLQNVPFFGLPGNPVSAMITFEIFVRPTLLKLAGLPDNTQLVAAIADEDIHSDGRRTYARVKLEKRNGQLFASTTGTQSSGALMSMVLADGLLIIPENQKFIPKGTELPVRLLR